MAAPYSYKKQGEKKHMLKVQQIEKSEFASIYFADALQIDG